MKNNSVAFPLVTLLCVLAAACTSQSAPEQHFYMFSSNAQSVENTIEVGIGSVAVAPYLRRSELMLQVGPQEMRPARYNRWAEPLPDGIRRHLRDELSATLGGVVDTDPRYRADWLLTVDVVVDRLHGDMNGSVTLDATYSISAAKTQKRRRITSSLQQSGSGYAALVDAQGELLTELASRIAVDLQELLKTESS